MSAKATGASRPSCAIRPRFRLLPATVLRRSAVHLPEGTVATLTQVSPLIGCANTIMMADRSEFVS